MTAAEIRVVHDVVSVKRAPTLTATELPYTALSQFGSGQLPHHGPSQNFLATSPDLSSARHSMAVRSSSATRGVLGSCGRFAWSAYAHPPQHGE